jgi:menaquinone-dependent protoporphyrinogen oxidase
VLEVLVATASRHGSTREIGDQIGAEITTRLKEHGVEVNVDVRDVDDVDDLAVYDALVLGSAVYMGRWLKSARKLVDREAETLQAIPVWLFSSGPVATDDKTTPESPWERVEWAEDHHTFGGKLDRSALSRTERLVASMVKAADGDNRSPAEIAEWAQHISTSLAASAVG